MYACIVNHLATSSVLSLRNPAADPCSRRINSVVLRHGKDGWAVKTLLIACVLFVGGVAVAEDRTILVPTDNKPFTADKEDVVRLTGKGIAGSKIEAKVTGPAKIVAEGSVRELVSGRPLIGNQVREFDIKPTGKGKVTVTITVTPPQPDAKPVETKYEFEVK